MLEATPKAWMKLFYLYIHSDASNCITNNNGVVYPFGFCLRAALLTAQYLIVLGDAVGNDDRDDRR
jgi:hypothetical protein